MPFPLHKTPRGLLELFRLRTLGSAPPQFGEQVLPVVETSEFYAAGNKLVSNATPVTGAIAGAGATATLTLTGQVRLHCVGVQLTIGAAPATNINLGVRIFLGATSCAVVGQFHAAAEAGATILVGAQIPRAWIILPGPTTTIQARVCGTAAGADHVVALQTIIDVVTTQAP